MTIDEEEEEDDWGDKEKYKKQLETKERRITKGGRAEEVNKEGWREGGGDRNCPLRRGKRRRNHREY